MKLFKFTSIIAGLSSVLGQNSSEVDPTRIEIAKMQEDATVFENLKGFMPDYSREVDIGVVALGMIYDWEALWTKESTIDQVGLDERREYIDEIMIEVT